MKGAGAGSRARFTASRSRTPRACWCKLWNLLYPLSVNAHLQRELDPKFERVLGVLNLDFEGETWLERGVLIFSQFYDSAYALADWFHELQRRW